MAKNITIRRARENNLKNISVQIPHNCLTVITGVSGSGKSSLAFDTVFREGQRRFLESFSGYSRQFMGKTYKPDVDEITGILPAIAIDQKSMVRSSRSTVGTISGLYDYLRLLFARIGKPQKELDIKIHRSLFSFNSPTGYCPVCKGLGINDKISQRLIVADENKTLREGALVITTPSGYIIYSQVTMEVMNQVCNAHGFNVDIPWKDLSKEEKHVVMYGSGRIKIPFGKHTLESRMKWTGIKAKPREEGYYKGIIPVMEEILKRDRNPNILRFAETVTCEACSGTKLREEALEVKIGEYNIADLSAMPVENMAKTLFALNFGRKDKDIAEPILSEIKRITGLFNKLRLDYLTLERESSTLSGGELQRLKLLGLIGSGITNVLYVFDEPGAGLHPSDNENLIKVMDSLISEGNTVIAVEHDKDTMRNADFLLDIGPKAGIKGGEIVFSGKYQDFFQSTTQSITKDYLLGKKSVVFNHQPKIRGAIKFIGCKKNNLDNIDVEIKLNELNVVCGVSGAGKTSLVKGVIAENLGKLLAGKDDFRHLDKIEGNTQIKKVLEVDRSPIGKTLRSNPATYIGLFDKIRDLFASLPGSKARKWKKGRFSFNTKGGRCEECEGAGIKNIGMHFLGNINAPCELCNGKRFNKETLEIMYNGKDISQVLDLSINQALEFFHDKKEIIRYLEVMRELGLGYLKLGQPSNTLSGGEAQRLKLAEELVKKVKQPALYIFDEPTVGLHFYDIQNLLKVFERILNAGHTILLIEHDPKIISLAGYLIELGPGSGSKGGKGVFSGTASQMKESPNSITAAYLNNKQEVCRKKQTFQEDKPLKLKDVKTHNLKNINLELPKNQVVTFAGVSGSGKSSLVYDTIYAEAANRYSLNLSAYIRSYLPKTGKGDFKSIENITPVVAINKKRPARNPRSIVATFTGIYDYLRILYTRFGKDQNDEPVKKFRLSDLSFNHEAGACPVCKGLGRIMACDPQKLVTQPGKSLINGALDGTKTGKFYGDPYGQYVAILTEVGKQKNIDFNKPYNELSGQEKNIAMYGCGKEVFEVKWEYKRKNRVGVHEFKGQWHGFTKHVDDEYVLKHQDQRGEKMLTIMRERKCSACYGNRIKIQNQDIFFYGKAFPSAIKMTVDDSIGFFTTTWDESLQSIIQPIKQKAEAMKALGLEYISFDREVSTLSSGEWQRLKIATHIYEGLTGITYILDEPSTGLHHKNIKTLSGIIQMLKQRGNSVFLVDHNPQVIKNSDRIIELGPGAGNKGGEIIFNSSPKDIQKCNKSLLKEYIDREWHKTGKFESKSPLISIKGANAHNLKNIDVDFYQGMINVITGVSGSGKSTLLFDVVYESLQRNIPVNCNRFYLESPQQVFLISDEQVKEIQRSTPITFTGLLKEICEEFTKNNDQSKKIKPSTLSFHSKEGQCPTCKGQGKIKVPMDFVTDVWLTCEQCNGKRYKPGVLKCSYNGKTISGIMSMPFSEAALLFASNKKLKEKLLLFEELGLGYLKLGHDFTSLSGGELQRIKLIRTLIEVKEPAIILMDEPSSGLHFKDIEKLLKVLYKLLGKGFTIIAIEHNQQFISHAKHEVELGPNGGKEGGEVVC